MELQEANTKSFIIEAPYESDLKLAVLWLKNNRVLKSSGSIRKDFSGRYVTTVSVTCSKKEARNLIKSRFGYFVIVL